MTLRNAYMTEELEAIYEQTVEFVEKEVTPHGEAWEEAGVRGLVSTDPIGVFTKDNAKDIHRTRWLTKAE